MDNIYRHVQTIASRRAVYIVILLLTVITLGAYWKVNDFGFISHDDPEYVQYNEYVKEGLSVESIKWAFRFSSSNDIAYWHPLTWISHMLDSEVFGIRAGRHHLMNVLYHLANSILLFLVFRMMTGSLWRSAFVAALFALHPVNVDSVAWVAERKNLLSSFFWILAMILYVYYTRKPGIIRYLLLSMVFVLGLLSKPMVVTLPFALLLLDIWPLGRLNMQSVLDAVKGKVRGHELRESGTLAVIREKIPLMIIAVIFTYLSSVSFNKLGVTIPTDVIPMDLRLKNAVVSYIYYIYKMIWPFNLTIFYPYPLSVSFFKVAGSMFLLIMVTVFALISHRKHPYVLVGWFWFLGTLLPVIGIKQGGLWPAIAERWAYLPYVGLFIILAWGLPELTKRLPLKGMLPTGIALLVLVFFLIRTWTQVDYWKDDYSLWNHALLINPDNDIAHIGFGIALGARHKYEESIVQFKEALRINPYRYLTHLNLGRSLDEVGKADEAIFHYRESLRLNPSYIHGLMYLGVALVGQGKVVEGNALFQKALDLSDEDDKIHFTIAKSLEEKGKYIEAAEHFSEVIRFSPGNASAHMHLGVNYAKLGRLDEALSQYHEAISIDPEGSRKDAYNNIGVALIQKGQLKEGISYLQRVLQLDPSDVEVRNNLGMIYLSNGMDNDAAREFMEATRIKPDSAEAHFYLGNVYVRQGRLPEAIQEFSAAVRIRPSYQAARHNLELARARYPQTGQGYDEIMAAIQKDPNNPMHYERMGDLLAAEGNPEKAIANYRTALSLQKGNTVLLQKTAQAYSMQGDFRSAHASLRKILEITPENPDTYYNIACIYAKEGKAEESIKWLRKALERGFRDLDLMRRDRDLDGIRGTKGYEDLLRSKG